jgi:hypothetical protein
VNILEALRVEIDEVRRANFLTRRAEKKKFYDALGALFSEVPEEENVAPLTRAEMEKLGDKILISQGVRL